MADGRSCIQAQPRMENQRHGDGEKAVSMNIFKALWNWRRNARAQEAAVEAMINAQLNMAETQAYIANFEAECEAAYERESSRMKAMG